MGDSNSAWGELVAHDDELAEIWDGFEPLPDPGVNEALDAFCDRKHISVNSLVRLGARLSEDTVLAFAGPSYLKFRDVVSDRRWSYAGSDWRLLKLVRAAQEPSETVLVAEGETDGARLSEAYTCDVAIMPAGAGYFPATYAEQLAGYKLVLAALDNDPAGERGAERVAEALSQTLRFPPPEGSNDWCSVEESFPPLPDPSAAVEVKVLVPAGELLELEPPEIVSWFERGLLPVGGQLIIHGWAKSYKSFIALDMLASLSQGQPWAGFEPSEEPIRAAVMQYEIPWPWYQQRIRFLNDTAHEPELFCTNFLTFTPTQRPKFVAGDKRQEDHVLKSLTDAGVQVFLLDPVRRATGLADLNDTSQIRPLLRFYERLQDNGITVVTVHHDNKTSARAGGGNPLGMTGAGDWAGDCDSIVSVAVPRGMTLDDPCRNLHFTLRNAPHIGPRGVKMNEDSHLSYAAEPYGDGLEGDDSGPAI